MNKRGQVYLVAGIIICMLAFLLVSKPNFIREQVLLQNFNDISNNYLTESPKVVNDVIEGQTSGDNPEEKLNQIKTQLSGFTDSFVDNYARNQDPNVGLIYIYNDENGVVIHNYLNNEIAHFDIPNVGGNINLLPGNTDVGGNVIIDGTGTGLLATTNLCANYVNENYCILTSKSLNGKFTLNIGDIKYNFNANPESPQLIVIIKSKEGDTVKVDVTENQLENTL